MAKLHVIPELIVETLFKGAATGVRIVGASFDGHVVVLDIEGVDVPDAEVVTAIMSVERFRVAFNVVK